VSAILPGATIGFLGGGQLARMAAQAARSMGYDVQVLDPDPTCPARAIASRTITAPYTDVAAAESLAQQCDVLTLDIEQIGTPAIAAASLHVPVRPGADVLHIVQDRARQKDWLTGAGFPVAAYRTVQTAEGLRAAASAFGRCIAKTVSGGYDGRGQVRITVDSDVEVAVPLLSHSTVVVEQWQELVGEISVMVARSPVGEMVTYPVAFNHHDAGVLTWSMMPAPVDDVLASHAQALAREVTAALGVVGVLAVEMFLLADGSVVINELAPRPHNTFHTTERSCATSQFEQQVRAVCGLPLGSTALVAPGAIINLLGDVWRADGTPPDWRAALQIDGVRLHLYGKTSARPGRKMGHLSVTASSASAARDRVRAAFDALRTPSAATR
jgi:5-(carboxyamino)imidazole ribonucleotide synthase